ncbi:hypothetical protein ACVNHC_24450, partial [Pannonibacter sp. Q-1]
RDSRSGPEAFADAAECRSALFPVPCCRSCINSNAQYGLFLYIFQYITQPLQEVSIGLQRLEFRAFDPDGGLS